MFGQCVKTRVTGLLPTCLFPSPLLFLFSPTDLVDFVVENLFLNPQKPAALFQKNAPHDPIGNDGYGPDNIGDQLGPPDRIVAGFREQKLGLKGDKIFLTGLNKFQKLG